MAKIQSDVGQIIIVGLPDKCPFCHRTITPNPLYGHKNYKTIEVLLICPNLKCQKSFIGYYDTLAGSFQFNGQITLGNLINKEFSDTINTVSQHFTTIYNQAFAAEQQNLTEICGVGYRKALEFLIKDYIINNNPTDKEVVEKKFLGSCISEYVEDERIKNVAKRAVWLGNDETHYLRKWEGKNLEDLKKLIDLTIHWIEMESLTKSFENEMPE